MNDGANEVEIDAESKTEKNESSAEEEFAVERPQIYDLISKFLIITVYWQFLSVMAIITHSWSFKTSVSLPHQSLHSSQIQIDV